MRVPSVSRAIAERCRPLRWSAFCLRHSIRCANANHDLCITKSARRLTHRPRLAASAGRSTLATGSFKIEIPLVVGAPILGRYCVFGNLFARSGLSSAPFRLDRHPTMQCHPVTPMNEADLRLHLSRQTSRPITLIDVVELDSGYDAARDSLDGIEQHGTIVLFDTLTADHLTMTGRLIQYLQDREQKPQFIAGSSGVEYALLDSWQRSGMTSSGPDNLQRFDMQGVDRILVMSGSCSPVTQRQIRWAIEHGFAEMAVRSSELPRSKNFNCCTCDVAGKVISLLDAGRSVIIHSGGTHSAAVNHDLGARLGGLLRNVLRARRVERLAIVGGDTSGHVARALEIEAVEMIGPLQPGAPLCVTRSRESIVDGIEITFKGGQVGFDDFFEIVRRGRLGCPSVGAKK